jgi:hypothetical protein
MELIGDLERLIAQNLYPLRVPLAIAGAVLLVGLFLVAWRLGWIAAARRHPVRSGLVAVALVALLAPVTWYLASPLFTRVELEEPPPGVAVVDLLPSGTPVATPAVTPSPAPPGGTDQPAVHTEAPTTTPEPTPTPAPLARRGTFQGADDFHFGRGTAQLIETEPGRHVVRFEDFAVRNGPDLYVYLSPKGDGYAKAAIELGRLKATDGRFNMPVPDGADVSGARSVVIWCKQFSVLFAVAAFEP